MTLMIWPAMLPPRQIIPRTDACGLQIAPDLSVQYYGNPFVSNGRYTGFKRATATHAAAYADRFHAFAPGETVYDPERNAYDVV